MIWLQEMPRIIDSHNRASHGQRDMVLVLAGRLSAICDQAQPRAPRPVVEFVSEEGDLTIGWLSQARHMALMLYVDADLAINLQLLDLRHCHDEAFPTDEYLKRAVECFFYGWVPSN